MTPSQLSARLFRYPFVLLGLLTILIFLAPWSCLAAERTITVGIYENPPKIFTDQGKPSGILIEILAEIARQERWQLQYVKGSWGECLDRLAKGEIDLMPDMAYSAERSRLYTFPHVPALSSWFQAYAPKGHGIRSILDLNHKRIMVLEQSIQESALERLRQGFALDCTLIRVPDYETMFNRVQQGEADVAVTNRFYGRMQGRQYGLEDTAVVFEPSDLFFVTGKGDPHHLLPAIDRHLAELKAHADSPYYRTLRKWTSEQVSFHLPHWLHIAAAVGGGLLLLSLGGSVLLKQQVNRRTRELKRVNAEMEQRIKERTAELAAITKEQLSIFESAGVGIVVLRNRTIVRCNRAMEEMTSYGPGELVGMSTRIWYSSDDAYERAGQQVYAQLTRGEVHRRSQQVNRKDGSAFWVRMSLCAFENNNPLEGAVGILEDVTEERQAAEKLRRAMEKAQEADRIKSAFLATMSHELRTPLNSIIGFTGILLQGLAGPLNDEQNKQLGMVQNSSRHLLSLINDVLDISKIEAGQLELAVASFDLRQAIDRVVKLMTPIAAQKKLTLVVNVDDDLGEVLTDQRRLEQILLNLLNNAIKFTEQQGTVTLDCRKRADQYRLRVIDSGIGIKKEEMERIFLPFHQVASGLARTHEGTGLGLAICKRLVERMGGTIVAESRLGQGSSFTVCLPLKLELRSPEPAGNGVNL
jgi:PAS domain S-box-containing protein